MTQEEKAKRYDEAIEKLRRLRNDYDTVSTLIDIKEELENIFTELKESEDEKIKKGLLYVIKHHPTLPTEEAEEYIAWLEKQGEQKPADIPQDFEKYVEHLLSLSDGEGHGSPAKLKEVCSELLRLAKLLQKPWSEERVLLPREYDEIETIACHLDNIGNEAMAEVLRNIAEKMSVYYKWLESLKSRNAKWIPSNAQMDAIKVAINCLGSDAKTARKQLTSLYEDLKKL